MRERLPTTDAELPVRRRATAADRATDGEVFAIVERAARVRDGLALVEQAPLESVAVLLGVAPTTIERVRAALEDPALREEAALRLARAEGKRPRPTAAGPSKTAQPPRDPDALLRAARAREGGLALLLDAAPECAAVVFGVHPELVARARERARTGPAPDAAAT